MSSVTKSIEVIAQVWWFGTIIDLPTHFGKMEKKEKI